MTNTAINHFTGPAPTEEPPAPTPAPSSSLDGNEGESSQARARRETSIVTEYLDYLDTASKPGRKVDPEVLELKLAELNEEIKGASPIERLEMYQRRENLRIQKSKLAVMREGLVEDFQAVLKSYSLRKGISWSSWREVGVPKDVLIAGGLERTRRQFI